MIIPFPIEEPIGEFDFRIEGFFWGAHKIALRRAQEFYSTPTARPRRMLPIFDITEQEADGYPSMMEL